MFQSLTHRRSLCFRITAESQPHQIRITASAKSPIHLFQTRITTESQPHRTAESQPLRNRRSTCFRLGSQPKHSHTLRNRRIHLFQARTTPESQPHHTRIIAASPPYTATGHSTHNIANPLASGTDRSGLTASLPPNHSRRQPHETQPDHSHITAES